MSTPNVKNAPGEGFRGAFIIEYSGPAQRTITTLRVKFFPHASSRIIIPPLETHPVVK
jgi:hypothetical protein